MVPSCILSLLVVLLISANFNCIGSLVPTTNAPLTGMSKVSLVQESYLHALSKKVAILANIPIFEFGQDITKILKMAEDESGFIDPSLVIDLELVFYDYMTKLRRYYFLLFINYRQRSISYGIMPTRGMLLEERDHSVEECRKAMQAALPLVLTGDMWSYQGPLLELESDIDTVIEDSLNNLPVDDFGVEVKLVTKRSVFLQKFLKRFRWVAAQTALLMFNFAQNEWQRRASKHLADRRLAEVPEFPLL